MFAARVMIFLFFTQFTPGFVIKSQVLEKGRIVEISGINSKGKEIFKYEVLENFGRGYSIVAVNGTQRSLAHSGTRQGSETGVNATRGGSVSASKASSSKQTEEPGEMTMDMLDQIEEESNCNFDESSLLHQSKDQEWKRYSMDQHFSLSPPQSLRVSRQI